MDTDNPNSGLELRTKATSAGELELSLVDVPIRELAADEVLVRLEATPINPSDIGLLLGPADMSAARITGTAERPVLTATIPQAAMKGIAGRLDQSLPVGNEGAGTVIKAGSNAEALLGKLVAIWGGAMYAEYRILKASDCVLLPEGVSAADGASAFVNPLTALGMIETMRLEGHSALVHTAAASNLGQMLNKICLKDDIGLVNIVRGAEQEGILRGIGAVHVCNSTSPAFMDDLIEAIAATGATLAFDAIGGGPLADQILRCTEIVAGQDLAVYSRYGSSVHKQVYIYGMLDTRPTELRRNYGFTWGVGGWLLFSFVKKIGPEAMRKLLDRVRGELKTTFASDYTAEISLAEALRPDVIAAYSRRATGAKYLINPSRDSVKGEA
jgi:NADPH:quinone reductase-like Zn-dependent oxidoreductase